MTKHFKKQKSSYKLLTWIISLTSRLIEYKYLWLRALWFRVFLPSPPTALSTSSPPSLFPSSPWPSVRFSPPALSESDCPWTPRLCSCSRIRILSICSHLWSLLLGCARCTLFPSFADLIYHPTVFALMDLWLIDGMYWRALKMAAQMDFRMDNFIGQGLDSFSFLISTCESRAFPWLIGSGTSFELLFPALIFWRPTIYSQLCSLFLLWYS